MNFKLQKTTNMIPKIQITKSSKRTFELWTWKHQTNLEATTKTCDFPNLKLIKTWNYLMYYQTFFNSSIGFETLNYT